MYFGTNVVFAFGIKVNHSGERIDALFLFIDFHISDCMKMHTSLWHFSLLSRKQNSTPPTAIPTP